MDKVLSPITKSTIVEQVFHELRRAILENKYQTGERLKVAELAEQFAVSQTPIREAIRMLEVEGLLLRHSKGRSVVAERSLDSMVEAFQVRIALESHAIRLATQKISEKQLDELDTLCGRIEGYQSEGDWDRLIELSIEFHGAILQIAGNARITKYIREINDHINVYRERLYRSPLIAQPDTISHRAIVEALRSRNEDRAQALMREHLKQSLDYLWSLWEES